MFFKNDSIYKIGMATKKGNVVIMPGDTIRILEMDLIEIDEHLTEISEEEFNKLNDLKEEDESKDDESKKNKSKKDESREDLDPNNIAKGLADKVKEIIDENKPSDLNTEKLKDELKEDPKEARLEMLKEMWNKATKPAEKAKIAKEIKKLQK